MSDVDVDRILRETIPQWNQADFVFLEPRSWWAPSVQSVLTQSDTAPPQVRFGESTQSNGPVTDYRCYSVDSTRAVHDEIQSSMLSGVVLVVGQQLRECLLLLGRLSRLCRPCPPVLVLIPRAASSLLPMLLEAGASSVMTDQVTDLQVADWCQRAANAANSGHSG